MITQQEVVLIGVVRKSHATRGEVVCELYNDYFDCADPDYLILELDHILVPFFVEEYRYKNDNAVLVKFEDISTAQQTLLLLGANVYLHQRQLPEGIEHHHVVDSFVGYKVLEPDNGILGTVVEVDTSTVNTLLVLDNGLLLPFHEDFLEDVDSTMEQLTLRVPEGLLNLASAPSDNE